jgi:hypothetical protein
MMKKQDNDDMVQIEGSRKERNLGSQFCDFGLNHCIIGIWVKSSMASIDIKKTMVYSALAKLSTPFYGIEQMHKLI